MESGRRKFKVHSNLHPLDAKEDGSIIEVAQLREIFQYHGATEIDFVDYILWKRGQRNSQSFGE